MLFIYLVSTRVHALIYPSVELALHSLVCLFVSCRPDVVGSTLYHQMVHSFLNIKDCNSIPNVSEVRQQFEQLFREQFQGEKRAAQFSKDLRKAKRKLEKFRENLKN